LKPSAYRDTSQSYLLLPQLLFDNIFKKIGLTFLRKIGAIFLQKVGSPDKKYLQKRIFRKKKLNPIFFKKVAKHFFGKV
jgi:hypothetical protein